MTPEKPAYGFEIQIEGALPSDLYYLVPGGRYGMPSVVPYATGVYVRYQSSYNPATGQYNVSTPPAATTAFSWQDCYLGGLGYSKSGCEHLGQSMRALPPGTTITVTGRWMVDDPANPGQLIGVNPPAAVPFVGWFVAPPVSSTPAPPIVVAKAVAPLPPPRAQFSDAQWVKIFKTELARPVSGDELTSTNTTVVPEDPTQIETAGTSCKPRLLFPTPEKIAVRGTIRLLFPLLRIRWCAATSSTSTPVSTTQ